MDRRYAGVRGNQFKKNGPSQHKIKFTSSAKQFYPLPVICATNLHFPERRVLWGRGREKLKIQIFAVFHQYLESYGAKRKMCCVQKMFALNYKQKYTVPNHAKMNSF